MPVGKLRGSIQLNLSTGTVDVPVLGTIKPVIQVVPEQIQFSSRSTNVTERLAMLRSGDGRPFEILSADLENADGSVETVKLAGNRWRCKLSIVPASISQGATLRITTSSKLQPEITVPLSVAR